MDSRVISGNLKAFDEASPFLLEHKFGEDLITKNKEERGSPCLSPVSREM
jgi:hypothetical protein